MTENSVLGTGCSDFLEHRMKRMEPNLHAIYSYWCDLRRDGSVPRREDFDPRAVERALCDAFVLDRARPGAVRLRVAGQNLNRFMGMEVRGMPIRAFFDLVERRRLMDLIETSFTTPSLLDLTLSAAQSTKYGVQNKGPARMLILPMLDHMGQVSKAMGVVSGLPQFEQSDTIAAARLSIIHHNLVPAEDIKRSSPAPLTRPSVITVPQPACAAPKVDMESGSPVPQLIATTVPYLKLVL